MVDINPLLTTGGTLLVLLAQLAFVVAGLAIMLSAGRFVGRILLLGLFLAIAAGLAPRFPH